MSIETHSRPRASKTTKFVRVGIYLIAAALLAALFAWRLVPGIVKRAIEDEGSAVLGRKLTAARVTFNPFTATATINDLRLAGVGSESATFASVAEVEVSVAVASLWHLAPVFDHLAITKPEFNLVRLSDSRFNFSDIVDKVAAPKSKSETKFAFENIHVRDGAIALEDKVVGKTHRISAINLAIPFISNLPRHANIQTEPAFSANVNGTSLKFTGKTQPFSDTLESTLDFVVRDLDVPTYLAYVPQPPPLPVAVKAGKLDVDATLVFRRAGAKTPRALLIKGGATLRAFVAEDLGGQSLLAFDALSVRGAELSPLATAASPPHFALGTVTLTKPTATVARRADNKLNWTDLALKSGGARALNDQSVAPAATNAATQPVVKIANVQIDAGRLVWRDALRRGGTKNAPFETTVGDIKLTVGAIDTSMPVVATPLNLSFAGSHAEAVTLAGKVSPLAANAADNLAELRVSVTALRAEPYRVYWQDRLNAFIEGGALKGAASINVFRGADEPSRIDWQVFDGSLTLGATRVFVGGERKTPIATTEAMTANDIVMTSATRRAAIGSLDATALKIRLQNAAGGWNTSRLLVNTPASNASDAPVLSAAPPPAWAITLAKLAAEGSLSVHDDTGTKPLRVNASKLTLAAQGLSTDADVSATINLQTTINRRGSLAITGAVMPLAKRGDLQIDARDLDLAAIDAFTTKVLNVELASGSLTYRGGVAFDVGATETAVKVVGRALVTNFLALDKVNGAEFARWRTLAVDGIDARIGKGTTIVSLGGVALADYYARLIVNANGRLNFQDILTKSDAVGADVSLTTPSPAAPGSTIAPPKPPEETRPIYRLGKLTLADGNINFTDNFIRPNYTMNLTGMTGSLSAVASDAPAPAEVTLRGRVDGDAPVAIDGRLNPLAKPMFLDMKGSAKGIELTRMTPYSAKYAGYAIDKGKLTMEIKYFIENNKLTADNRVFLDQLTFGDEIESPTATKLPVRLAVALLKNSRGEIDINLPIEGSIDDPQFSVGGVIVQVIVNLLSKAVTSPFALLGSAFGGGDELGTIEFVPGSPLLDEKSRDKIEKLATALKDRPALKLDITGRVDVGVDAEGIRRENLKNQVLAQKLKSLVARGRSIGVDALTISAEEYPTYLEAAYTEATFPKPRNLLGMAKSLPVPEMETLILTNTPFTEAEQRKLANERVDEVRRALRETLGDEVSARVYVVAPKLSGVGLKDGDNPARVEFALRH